MIFIEIESYIHTPITKVHTAQRSAVNLVMCCATA